MTPEVLQREVWAPPRSAELASQIARSQARYLSLAAGLTPLPGAVLAAVEGLTDLPGACAVIVLDASAAAHDPRAWIRAAEAGVRARGAAEARIHLDGPAPALERELAALGYERRVEDILLTPPGPAPSPEDLRLVAGPGPPAPDAWRRLMRRKHEAGGLECHLLESGGRFRGTVGVLPMPDALRITALVVEPDDRGEGVGLAALRAVWRMAVERGRAAAGVLARPGTPCAELCASAGLRPAGAVIEWSRVLPTR